MTLAARALNRVVLLVIGVVALAVALTAAWPLTTGAPAPWLAALFDVAHGLGWERDVWTIAAVGAAAVVVLLSATIVATRPPRRVRVALEEDGVVVDETIVADLLHAELADARDVVAVSASTLRRRAGRIVRLRVQVRPRSDVVEIRRRVGLAVDALDERLGASLPVVVQLTGGVRGGLAGERRVV